MRFKVGDKVRVRKDLKVGKINDDLEFTKNMCELKDKIITIENVMDYIEGYYIKEDEMSNIWTDEMLEPVEDIIEYKGKKYDVIGKNGKEEII